jgi:hypothetical protein
MKKILNEWKNFIKEDTSSDALLDKVRDIFFGAYNSWDSEYKMLHDDEFDSYFSKLKDKAAEFYDQEKIDKVIGGANIGISLYWSDNPQHGAGSPEAVSFLINKKLKILESQISPEEEKELKSGLMESIIAAVSGDRSNQMYPTTLAVSVGVINGLQVIDAYMTTAEGLSRFVVPILKAEGYYSANKPAPTSSPKSSKRKKYDSKLSLDDMKAMMQKFGRQ